MKWLLIALAAVAALVALVALAGAVLPRRHSATRAAVYRQPPAAVWRALTDWRAFPSWRPEIRSVRELPQGRLGWIETSAQGELPLAVERQEEPALLVLRIADESLPFGGTWTWRLEPTAEGTRLTITEDGEVKNPIFRFLARFVFGHTRTMETYLRNLGRRFGEEVVPAPPSPD
jgi:uncharacterized protein YndB with AHSA1/START domain